MQHVLPSRSVCVAYHGMSIPLPATSLRGALSSSMTERRALQPVSNVVQGGPKDSGCQSQLTASEVSYGGSVTTAAEPVGAGSNTGSQCGRGGKRGVSQTEEKCLTSSELDRESSDSEVPPVLKPLTESPTVDSNRRSFIATDVLTGCSLIAVAESTGERVSPRMSPTVSSKVEDRESKRAWVQAGRGRALQQFVSQLQLSPPVGKSQTQSTSPNSVCGVQPKAEACMNDLHLSPNTPEDSVSLPSLGEASICDENDATINDTSLQDVVLPTETTATVPDEIAISPTQPREDSVPSSSVVRPATTTGSANRKTPKSSRKARVSLAIQFRGTCTPHRSPALVASQKPVPPPPEKTREPKSCLASQTNSLDAAQVNTEDDKPATLEQQPGAGDPGERVLQELDDDEDSQEDVLTQVSEMEECDLDLDECCQLSNEGREPSSPAASEGIVSSPLRREVVSSDEEELDSAGVRMGRSADDVERSIAVHQRNIHRNLVYIIIHDDILHITLYTLHSYNIICIQVLLVCMCIAELLVCVCRWS